MKNPFFAEVQVLKNENYEEKNKIHIWLFLIKETIKKCAYSICICKVDRVIKGRKIAGSSYCNKNFATFTTFSLRHLVPATFEFFEKVFFNLAAKSIIKKQP